MKRRSVIIATYFGRVSCWAIGLGLLAIGIGEALNCAMCVAASERQE